MGTSKQRIRHLLVGAVLATVSALIVATMPLSAQPIADCHHTRCAAGNCGFGFMRNCAYIFGGLGCEDKMCAVN